MVEGKRKNPSFHSDISIYLLISFFLLFPSNSFRVIRKERFESTVLRRYFKITKMKSFIRQLNLYNFTRVTAGRDKGSYYHRQFLRGRADLCGFIRRKDNGKFEGN